MPQGREAALRGMTIGVKLLQDAFIELTAAFARHDSAAAEEAIGALETSLAKRLKTYRESTSEGADNEEPLNHAAMGLRQTIQRARQRVRAAETSH